MKMALSLADSDMVVKKEISKIINKKFIDQTIRANLPNAPKSKLWLSVRSP